MARKRKASSLPGGLRRPAKKAKKQLMLPYVKKFSRAILKGRELNLNANPIKSIHTIFDRMSGEALRQGLSSALAGGLRHSPIRVATMCSGTESPILALKLITEACIRRGEHFAFEHMFSAEIVPFKQAFIERNFQPPLLFRDITTLKQGQKSQTAYAAPSEVPSPGEVDILVAGFACVDFSKLNNKPKGLNFKAWQSGNARRSANDEDAQDEEGGESSSTFNAIHRYAEHFRPGIIILENVTGAPWKEIVEAWEWIDYAAMGLLVDTKDYYIPHTRQRGYMICVNHGGNVAQKLSKTDAQNAAVQWCHMMMKLRYRASAPVDDFLLPIESPVLSRSTEEITQAAEEATLRKEISWHYSRERHRAYRAEHGLGDLTPFSRWKTGRAKVPSFANVRWSRAQVNRLKDLWDIVALHNAGKHNFDGSYKSRFFDISQNADRNLDNAAMGVVGCITPSGMMYSSYRGGLLVGLEALSLQGMPMERIHITTETHKQLVDLAGNAMSTTVVGAALLSAIAQVNGAIVQREHEDTEEVRTWPEDIQDSTLDKRIALDFGIREPGSARVLQEIAIKTAQFCPCEGQQAISSSAILKCRDCNTKVCRKCAGNPEHKFHTLETEELDRLAPSVFLEALRKHLPTALFLDTAEILRVIAGYQPQNLLTHILASISDQLRGENFRLNRVIRGGIWNANYDNSAFRLELSIGEKVYRWRLFLGDEALDYVRDFLRTVNLLHKQQRRLVKLVQSEALAVMDVDCNSSTPAVGQWQIRVPTLEAAALRVVPKGDRVPSWKSELGLKKWKKQKVPTEQIVAIDRHHKNAISMSSSNYAKVEEMRGVYQLLPSCGTANRALHIQKGKQDPHYLFFDPAKTGPAFEDEFVISKDIRRIQHGESRQVNLRMGHALAIREVEHGSEDLDIKSGFEEKGSATNISNKNTALEETSKAATASTFSGSTLTPLDSPEKKSKSKDTEHSKDQNLWGLKAAVAGSQLSGQAILPEKDQDKKVAAQRTTTAVLRNLKPGTRLVKWNPAKKTTGALAYIYGTLIPTRLALKMPEDSSLRLFAAKAALNQTIVERNLSSCQSSEVTAVQGQFPWIGNDPDSGNCGGYWRVQEHQERLLRVDVSWFLTRITDLVESPDQWLPLTLPSTSKPCEHCVPERPAIKWRLVGKSKTKEKMVPFEDPAKASEYEASVKNRPSPVTTHVFINREKSCGAIGLMFIRINMLALAHRAIAYLQPVSEQSEPPKVFWRLDCDYLKSGAPLLPSFSLTSNANDEGVEFNTTAFPGSGDKPLNLFREQQRAFGWMLQRDALGGPNFTEEVFEEYHSPNLGWLLEAKASRPRRVRGGVVADEVGFGKTVTTIALMRATTRSSRQEATALWSHRKAVANARLEPEGQKPGTKIPVRATCVLVPTLLLNQWVDELNKFWGSSCKLVKINSVPTLKKLTVGDIIEADVVLVSQGIFDKTEYLNRTAELSGLPEPPELKAARPLSAWMSKAQERIQSNITLMMADPFPRDFQLTLLEQINSFEGDDVDFDIIPSKRLRGKAFAASQAKKALQTQDNATPGTASQTASKRTAPIKGLGQKRSLGCIEFPVLSMFEFQRKVIDEHTYLQTAAKKAISTISARSNWILSGTPALQSFRDVEKLADYIGVSLGARDDNIISPYSNRRKQTTEVELFESFQQTRTAAWHSHRHEAGRRFLDMFARQNFVESSYIKSTELFVPVEDTPMERALHLEMETLLLSEGVREPTIRKGEDHLWYSHDRDDRASVITEGSDNVQVSLLKNAICWHVLPSPEAAKAIPTFKDKKASKEMWSERDRSVRDLYIEAVQKRARRVLELSSLFDHLKTVVGKRSEYEKRKQHSRIKTKTFADFWARMSRANHQSDRSESRSLVLRLPSSNQERDHIRLDRLRKKVLSNEGTSYKTKRALASEILALPEKGQARVLQEMEDNFSDEKGDLLKNFRICAGALVKAKNELRFLQTAEQLQRSFAGTGPPLRCLCHPNQSLFSDKDLFVNTLCGHVYCKDCFGRAGNPSGKMNTYCGTNGCRAAILGSNVVHTSQLISRAAPPPPASLPRSPARPAKLRAILAAVHQTRDDEQVLLFSQLPAVTRQLLAALRRDDVPHHHVTGEDNAAQLRLIDAFRKRPFGSDDWVKVLVLNPADVSAAGHNLTSASLAIFVAPLLVRGQERFESCCTQAIGRIKRYGQKGRVRILHFLLLQSFDVNLMERRRKGRFVEVPPEAGRDDGESMRGGLVLDQSKWPPRAREFDEYLPEEPEEGLMRSLFSTEATHIDWEAEDSFLRD